MHHSRPRKRPGFVSWLRFGYRGGFASSLERNVTKPYLEQAAKIGPAEFPRLLRFVLRKNLLGVQIIHIITVVRRRL